MCDKGMESRQKFLESQGLSREGVGGGDEGEHVENNVVKSQCFFNPHFCFTRSVCCGHSGQ